MYSNALIRCDFFSGSGLGHLKRSAILAEALEKRGVGVTLVVDEEPLNFGWIQNLRFETFPASSFHEDEDAMRVIAYSRMNDVQLVLVDSYRITGRWIDKVKAAGLALVAIDDLNTLTGADLRVNYAPLSKPLEECPRELLGPSYFITDARRSNKPDIREPKSVIFHAGGTGDFSSNANLIHSLSSEAREQSLSVTWLVANQSSKSWLREKKMIDPLDSVQGWSFDAPMAWGNFDIVVGPASTSLYECIIQGSLPISYTISSTQKDDRSTWLSLGHALHITKKESEDSLYVRRIFETAVNLYSCLRRSLSFHSKQLDGLGSQRITQHLLDEPMLPSRAHSFKATSPKREFKICELSDAEKFLNARNSGVVRSLSTHSHEITWPEHLNWWLTSNAEKFSVTENGKTTAFFWHLSKVFGSNRFLVGGWFPADNHPSFDTAIHLLDWQLNYCSVNYKDHLWVATINPLNKAVIALNKRFGFQEASRNTRDYLNELFPGTPDNFIVLERSSSP